MEMLSGAEMIVQSLINEVWSKSSDIPAVQYSTSTMPFTKKQTKLNTFWFVTNKPQHIWLMAMRAPLENRA